MSPTTTYANAWTDWTDANDVDHTIEWRVTYAGRGDYEIDQLTDFDLGADAVKHEEMAVEQYAEEAA